MNKETKGFLARHGAALIDNGYYIVPIKRGEKRPPFTAWEKIRADNDQLRSWLDDGYGQCGVGIIAADTPGVDLDIRDLEIAEQLERWILNNVADAPIRIGQAPKRLLMFRTDEPFTKLKSTVYVDDFGDQHHVEILGEGQQYVAFHIHPDTREPYEWVGDSPLEWRHDDLPTLTVEAAQAIIAEFERIAVEQNWKPKAKKTSTSLTTRQDVDDPFLMDDSRVTDLTDEEFHAKLLMVPAQPDYDSWLQIGMALYHQYKGDGRGLELWHEWSEQAYPDEYDADEIDRKWSRGKLDIEGKRGKHAITARLIIKLANEHAEKLATEVVADVMARMNEAATLAELKDVAKEAKHIEFDQPTREQLVGTLRQRFKAITKTALSLKTARDMVRYENEDARDLPRWLEEWVYITSEDKFFHRRLHSAMTQTAFNSAYSRFMLTKKDVAEGRAFPERLPKDVALNIHQIPVVDQKLYLPGIDDIFTMNGRTFVNLYSDRSVPEVPDEPTKRDKRNVEIVRKHFTHLFPDERESRMFIDFIAFVVQNPGKIPGWAIVIQGTEGDGKSFFSRLLAKVLGAENVKPISAKVIQTDFDGWAEGTQIGFVEEIRLHGHNRFDVLNSLKEKITNDTISIHRKGVDPYSIPNVTAYILATNFRDAMPLDDNDSRYFVLFSRFQTKFALSAFLAANPTYYADLHAAIEDSPGAIRGWLLQHEFGPEFTTGRRAPESRAKRYMAMMAKTSEQLAIEEILASSMRFDLCRELLSATDLAEAMVSSDEDEIPQTSKLPKYLSDMGFTFLGRFRIGRLRRFWSQTPERFQDENGEFSSEKIREWLDSQL